jgi:uncharacterized protein
VKACVKEILSQGLDLEASISPQELALETPHVQYASNIHVRAHLTREKDIVTVGCSISTLEKLLCSRCLEFFDRPFEKQAEFIYKINHEHTINLNENIKEAIILEYPIKQLCSDNCKGLCCKCGTNLNHNTCSCK